MLQAERKLREQANLLEPRARRHHGARHAGPRGVLESRRGSALRLDRGGSAGPADRRIPRARRSRRAHHRAAHLDRDRRLVRRMPARDEAGHAGHRPQPLEPGARRGGQAEVDARDQHRHHRAEKNRAAIPPRATARKRRHARQRRRARPEQRPAPDHDGRAGFPRRRRRRGTRTLPRHRGIKRAARRGHHQAGAHVRARRGWRPDSAAADLSARRSLQNRAPDFSEIDHAAQKLRGKYARRSKPIPRSCTRSFSTLRSTPATRCRTAACSACR